MKNTHKTLAVLVTAAISAALIRLIFSSTTSKKRKKLLGKGRQLLDDLKTKFKKNNQGSWNHKEAVNELIGS